MTLLEKIQEEIEQLSQSEKVLLTQALLEDLDQSNPENEKSIEAAWEIEIEKRIAEIKSGKVVGVPAEEVFNRIIL